MQLYPRHNIRRLLVVLEAITETGRFALLLLLLLRGGGGGSGGGSVLVVRLTIEVGEEHNKDGGVEEDPVAEDARVATVGHEEELRAVQQTQHELRLKQQREQCSRHSTNCV